MLERLFGKAAVESGDYPARFRCVQVHASASPCQAAREIDGELFFPDEIPKLPLAECDRSECNCRYELRDDRRSAEREPSEAANQ